MTDYIARAQEALKAGFTSKAAQKSALDDVNRAYAQKVGEITAKLLASGERDEQWNALYWGTPRYPHEWRAKHSELFASNGFSHEVSQIEAVVRFRAVVKEAPVNKPAPKAPVTPAPEENRMTCQICGRPIQSNTGLIAHHGYTRPGEGWQTSSCRGARHLPFEVSRDELVKHIASLNNRHDNLVGRIEEIDNGTAAVASVIIANYDAPRPSRSVVLLSVSAETFGTTRAQHPKTFSKYSFRSVEDLLKVERRERNAQVSATLAELETQSPRADNWKQTHTWDGTGFRPV